jgi:tRNA A37 threonylcarbamoyladenosine synthetase subunit TsaC/SUA5/YrdC
VYHPGPDLLRPVGTTTEESRVNRALQLDERPSERMRPDPGRRPVVDNPEHAGWAARALADGAVVAHGFANLYAVTTRPNEQTVRRVNVMKGRPPAQVGSLTTAAPEVTDVWDLAQLPAGLTRRSVLEIVDAFLALGPFGFRGPAARRLPEHLTAPDGGVRTAQVIAPGHRCPSNHFLRLAMQEAGQDHLYVTSANRSHHQTGAEDSPAHWKAAGLLAEFGDQPDFLVLEHDNEDRARERYPHFLPKSTSVLSLHTVRRVQEDARPHLVLERHGSLSVDVVRQLLADLGFGLVLGPRATVRLQPRDYLSRLCDR